ncbi:MAG: PadR family transcriptional regulator [Steroidobacteraceae bacterium]
MPKPHTGFAAGLTELLVLRLLSQREMYGYEIARAARIATGEVFQLGEGVLYPLLHALEAQRLLSSRRQRIDGRTRVYYALTPKGGRRLKALTDQWQRLAGAIGNTLTGSHHV